MVFDVIHRSVCAAPLHIEHTLSRQDYNKLLGRSASAKVCRSGSRQPLVETEDLPLG